VEVPCALPLIFSGLRSSMLQIIATATIAAVVGLGGLGRFLIDGQANRKYDEMAGGAILVAVLALLVDLVFAALQRYAVSPGLASEARR
ncbi:MAG: ABC transporter permease subunit, partial [Actinomycetales bacterium]|nr:ABC transporter permease subunit [Actinomycetales bacterium]